MKLIEEKMGKSLELIGTEENFPNRTPLAQALRSIINKWDFMKQKNFSKVKDTISQTKWQPIEWEKMFVNIISDRGIISQI